MDMYEVFAQNPLLAILRNVPKEITLDYAGAILRGGVKVFEVALNSPDALEQITLLHKPTAANVWSVRVPPSPSSVHRPHWTPVHSSC